MWKKIAIAGSVAAAILGTGAAALAETGTTTSGTPAPSASSASSGSSAGSASKGASALRGKLKLALGRFEHGTWVSEGKGGTGTVTHAAVKGTVSAVSASSISVKAADGTTETFVVNTSTAVRVKGTGKSTIAAVKANDTVLLTGTQSGSTDTAVHILDGGAK